MLEEKTISVEVMRENQADNLDCWREPAVLEGTFDFYKLSFLSIGKTEVTDKW
jgi:hypothetical protein